MMKSLFLTLSLLLFVFSVEGQRTSTDVFVDKNGVLRWGNSEEEIKAFGINYTVPFAHAYRTAKNLGVDIEKAIDDDVYHFARLGFDLYRVHVWDTEISDTLGNLISNENLRLFDYMVKKMKDRGMKFIITPIAYWGNGWPEPDEKTPGFSSKYGKDASLTNPEAIKAQERYLFQFLNHVNPYTGMAYKYDPDIIAFEISNEPHHREAPEKVTAFINRMVKSMEKTGCKKPILYNITHSIHLADAYFKSGIKGGTFQWYPSGLGARHELGGNYLPNVDVYTVPFAKNPKFRGMARIVYEFDAADIGRSYIYPAIARSFREAGMQVGAHFSYDPTYMAYANTEYGTHYMNLVYTPQKALSLMIASEVFHKVPLNKSFGRYPQNTSFDDFRVSYEQDLAELNTEQQFIYTNTTTSLPKASGKLEQVAGSGNSTVVHYEGTGAYFLDKLENGVWRLEVMPDAVWVRDPFERTSLKKEIALINWRAWPMKINLPDLGEQFSVKGLNEGNRYSENATDKKFTITPGTYLLTREGVKKGKKESDKWKNISLGEYAAPSSTVKKTYVLHKPLSQLSEGKEYTIDATIISATEPEEVTLHVWTGARSEVLKMSKKKGYTYTAKVLANLIQPGFLRYFIVVKENGIHYTYPSGVQTHPHDWDFFAEEAYTIPVVEHAFPIYLFDAYTDTDQLIRRWVRGSGLVPSAAPGKAEFRVIVDKLFVEDPENKNQEKIYDYSMKYFFGNKIEGRRDDLDMVKEIIFHGRSLNDKPCFVQVALVSTDGNAFGKTVLITPDKKDYSITLAELQPIMTVLLPRPFPTFLPYYFQNLSATAFKINEMESIQISIGPGIPEKDLLQLHGIAVESIRLR
jgi:hypothetical protein